MKKHSEKPIQTEEEEQRAVITWARTMRARWPELRLLSASMNGVRVPMGVRRKMKALGLEPGFPDLQLPVARHGYHGLFIEMKRKGGRVSKEQDEFLKALKKGGYLAGVCFGADNAIDILEWYLKG